MTGRDPFSQNPGNNSRNRSRSAYPGHGYGPPPVRPGVGPPPQKKRSKAGLIALVVLVVLGLGVGGFFAANALTGREDSDGSEGPVAAEGSGQIFSPDKPYSVEIPNGVVRIPQRTDHSIPSETDLSLELEGKVNSGGLIKTGTLSGPAANASFDDIGAEAARGYASEYEGHPDRWGKGARVEKRTIKVGGRDAVEISTRFSPDAQAKPSIFFRVYFIDPPSGSTILITCDWNTTETEGIEAACDTLVASFKAKGTPASGG